MIRKLNIVNFKSHKDTKLEFDPGVNIIVGDPQSGKTNIIRALKLLVDNRPLGADKIFPTFAGDKADVYVGAEFDNGSVELTKSISRTKKGDLKVKDASYVLDGKKDDGYSGVASNVPDLVKEKINLSELNFQFQFDKPFLAMSSPGEIAKTINKITRLENVDTWVSSIRSDINFKNKEVTKLTQRNNKIDEELSGYDGLDHLDDVIKEFENVTSELDSKAKEAVSLRRAIYDLEILDNVIENFDCLLEDELLPVVAKVEEVDEELNVLYTLQKFVDADNIVITIEEAVAQLDELLEDVTVVQKHIDELNDLNKLILLDDGIKDLDSEKKSLEKDYKDRLLEAGICPTCGSEVYEAQVKEVLK